MESLENLNEIIKNIIIIYKNGGLINIESAQKWKYTLITTVIFLTIANPYTYMVVNYLLGRLVKIASPTGCPTTAGLLVRKVVLKLLLRYIMDLNYKYNTKLN